MILKSQTAAVVVTIVLDRTTHLNDTIKRVQYVTNRTAVVAVKVKEKITVFFGSRSRSETRDFHSDSVIYAMR